MSALDLFTLPDCICGDRAVAHEYPGEVKIGGWCGCPLAIAPIGVGPDYATAREDFEMQLSGSLPLTGAQGKG